MKIKNHILDKRHKLLSMLEEKKTNFRIGWFSCPTQADEIRKDFKKYLDLNVQEFDDVDGRYLLSIDKKTIKKFNTFVK